MSTGEQSAEAVVVKKPGNAGGAKGRRSSFTTDKLRSDVSSYPEHDGAATAAATEVRAKEARVDSRCDCGTG